MRVLLGCLAVGLAAHASDLTAQSRTPLDRAGGDSFATPPPPPSRPGPVTPSDPGRADAAPRTLTPADRFDFPAFGRPPGPGIRPGDPVLSDAPAHEPGELLILWPSPAAAETGAGDIATRFKVQPAERIELPHLGRVLTVYRLASTLSAADLKSHLTLARGDRVVDYNTRYALLGQPRLYAAGKMGLRDPVKPARRVSIGLLDTAVEPIAALRRASIVRKSFLRTGEMAAASAHGTALAALLVGEDAAAGFQGLAVGCALYAAEVVRRGEGRETTNVALLLRASDWLIGQRVEVINASLGGPPNRLLHELLAALSLRGIPLVAAAGNDGPAASPVYPAAYPDALAVTATDALDRIYAQANHGGYVDLSAPGVDLWVPGGAAGRYVSGTSFAAALVTGAVALHLAASAAPSVSAGATSVEAALCRSARDLGRIGRDPVFGCGLLQLGVEQRALR
jgi:hypothetical protein